MADVEVWFSRAGQALVAEVDRLWPEEGAGDPAYRGACLAEEVGEVNRAITKRRHAQNAPDGLCKGKSAGEWSVELAMELGQVFGVILDIAHREGVSLVPLIEHTIETLQARERGT